jgi:hypothetical protein
MAWFLPGEGGSRENRGVPVSRKGRLLLPGYARVKAFGGAAPLEKKVPQWGSPEKKQRMERIGAGT